MNKHAGRYIWAGLTASNRRGCTHSALAAGITKRPSGPGWRAVLWPGWVSRRASQSTTKRARERSRMNETPLSCLMHTYSTLRLLPITTPSDPQLLRGPKRSEGTSCKSLFRGWRVLGLCQRGLRPDPCPRLPPLLGFWHGGGSGVDAALAVLEQRCTGAQPGVHPLTTLLVALLGLRHCSG